MRSSDRRILAGLGTAQLLTALAWSVPAPRPDPLPARRVLTACLPVGSWLPSGPGIPVAHATARNRR